MYSDFEFANVTLLLPSKKSWETLVRPQGIKKRFIQQQTSSSPSLLYHYGPCKIVCPEKMPEVLPVLKLSNFLVCAPSRQVNASRIQKKIAATHSEPAI